MNVLVVGAGIAGLSAARLLSDQGHAVTIIERARAPHGAGYMIDFFGPGFDAAQRMGLLALLERIHYPIHHLLFCDMAGRALCDMDYPRLRQDVFRGRHFNFMRGELEQVLLDWLGDRAQLRHGCTVEAITPAGDEVEVRTSLGTVERYGLVIGADGVHSRVRELILPEQASYLPLGARTAAFLLDHDFELPTDRFVSVVRQGRTAAAYPIRGDQIATFFVYRAQGTLQDRSTEACFEQLRREYADGGELTAVLLDRLSRARDVFFDDVVQVRMTQWSRGRVVLIGDACGCVSLLAGQGASMAMAGAYILAQELARGAQLAAALSAYEARVRPAVEKRQHSAERNRSWLMPASERRAHFQLKATDLVLHTPLARWTSGLLGGDSIPLEA